MTRWSPDTCSCELDYDDRTFAHVASVSICKKHAGLSGQPHLDAVLSHNRAKNTVLTQLVNAGIDPLTVSVGYDRNAVLAKDPVLVTCPSSLKESIASLMATTPNVALT